MHKLGVRKLVNLYERIEKLCQNRGIDITTMCRESGAPRGSLTDLKAGRITGLSARTLQKIAAYFDVPVGYLLGEEKKPLVNEDEDLTDLLQWAKDDPDVRMLFSVTRDATPEDIKKAIKIIQALKGE